MSRPRPHSARHRHNHVSNRGGDTRRARASGSGSSTSLNSENEWRTRPNITIRVNNLPVDVSTEHIYRWFASEGSISRIHLFDNKTQYGRMSANILFEPPPRRMFWGQGQVRVEHPEQYPYGLRLPVSAMEYNASSNNTNNSIHLPKVVSKLSSLGFGVMLSPRVMRVMKAIDGPGTHRLELDVKQKTITVFFSHISQTGDQGDLKQWKVRFQISNIKTILESTIDDDLRHLVFSLPYAPEYFGAVDDILDTFQGNPQSWYANDTWYRATDIAPSSSHQRGHPIAIHNETLDNGHIDIGRWTAFRLSFNFEDVKSQELYSNLHLALSTLNVSTYSGCDFNTQTEAASLWDYLDYPSAVHTSQPSALLGMPQKIHLPFEVRYQLEVCISRGILNEYTTGLDFLKLLGNLQTRDATHRLEYLVDQNEPLLDPMELFTMEDAKAYVPSIRIPHYCTYVRKASITPTTIRFNSPTVETSNRVVRKCSHLQDRFLRIQFVEESELDRVGKNKENNDEIWRRVERALFQGVRIGDRLYKFLAFGSSQLRQSSAYFFCPTDHLSCEDIRAWMGQFDHIKCVAKYAARLGQCFSTTRDIRGIWMPNIKYIDDIEKNGYCFTDGVGLISEFLSRVIIEEMALDIFDEPTAFQFRMGGCKGVLAVWPQAKGMEVHIRNSQEKFKSDFQGLEICRCAARSTATLNRQTITILESLGVPKQAFMKLLKDQINWFESAAKDNSIAIELLTKFVDENQSSLVLAELLKAGFNTDGVQEPFTLNLLGLWISWSFRLLREKARIHVPKSAFVLGCVDESGTLRGHSIATEGSTDKDIQKLPQIFLQLTDPKRCGQTNIIRGVCVVGRNPSLHPGDIRVVQAVDNPKLRHLKDVVVFPSKGDRPVPAMLSGGDLDGDDFFIIWDPDLIPLEWNHPAMNYEAPSPRQLDRDVAVDDLREFFVNYMKNDVLPLIAVAHLGFADEYGPKSQICLELAKLHSKAVDYAKTGEPAEFGSKLQPKKWPHFMEKRSTYKSNKALGALFDEVVRHSFQFRPEWEDSFDKRILERYDLDEDILTAASTVKAQYDAAVGRLLVQYKVETEFELYSSWIMSTIKTSNNYKRQEDVGREFDALKQRFREQCCNIAGGSEQPQLDKFVAAMYKVTEQEVKKALSDNANGPDEGCSSDSPRPIPRMPLISFPWIFHWVMIRLAMGDKYKAGKSVLAAARRTHLSNRLHSTTKLEVVDSTPATPPPDVEINDKLDQSRVSGAEKLEGHSLENGIDLKQTRGIGQVESIPNGAENTKQSEIEDMAEDHAVFSNSRPVEAAVDRLAALLGFGDDE